MDEEELDTRLIPIPAYNSDDSYYQSISQDTNNGHEAWKREGLCQTLIINDLHYDVKIYNNQNVLHTFFCNVISTFCLLISIEKKS